MLPRNLKEKAFPLLIAHSGNYFGIELKEKFPAIWE